MEFYKSLNICCHLRRNFLCLLIICLLLKCLASSVCISIECRWSSFCYVFIYLLLPLFLSVCLSPVFRSSFHSFGFFHSFVRNLRSFCFCIIIFCGQCETLHYCGLAEKMSAIWHDMTYVHCKLAMVRHFDVFVCEPMYRSVFALPSNVNEKKKNVKIKTNWQMHIFRNIQNKYDLSSENRWFVWHYCM